MTEALLCNHSGEINHSVFNINDLYFDFLMVIVKCRNKIHLIIPQYFEDKKLYFPELSIWFLG
jgi:hypothetical protein